MPGQLYKLDSHYGNEQQLKELLAKLKDAGIDPLCDIVINHRWAPAGSGTAAAQCDMCLPLDQSVLCCSSMSKCVPNMQG